MSEYSWESEDSHPWEREIGGWETADSEAWRGDIHFDDWSDDLAGPSSWLSQREDEDDE